MRGGEKGIGKIIGFYARGNTHIAIRKLGHERMMGFILSTAFKIKTQLANNVLSKR